MDLYANGDSSTFVIPATSALDANKSDAEISLPSVIGLQRRRLTVSEADAILDMIDEQPRADQIAEGRAQLALVHRAMTEMPTRRRAIFEAAWIRDVLDYIDCRDQCEVLEVIRRL